MATDTFNFYNDFKEQLLLGIHDWDAHTFKVALSNTLPVATHTILANITEITAGNGYTAGGTATTITATESPAGTGDISGTDVVFTASGGAIAQFQYAILYNDSATSPADALVGWVDYGAAVDLADTETFTVDLSTNGIFTLT